MGLMSVMFEWVHANMSILLSKTYRNFSFSSYHKRELAYVCLSCLPRSNDSRGSIANCSLSSPSARVENCDCYSEDCGSVARLLGLVPFSRSHLTVDSIGELLIGCSRGQSIRH